MATGGRNDTITRNWFQDGWLRETFGQVLDECVGLEEKLITENSLFAVLEFLTFCQGLRLKNDLCLFGIRNEETLVKLQEGKILEVMNNMTKDQVKKLLVYYNYHMLEKTRDKINSCYCRINETKDKGKEKIKDDEEVATIDLLEEENALRQSFNGNLPF